MPLKAGPRPLAASPIGSARAARACRRRAQHGVGKAGGRRRPVQGRQKRREHSLQGPTKQIVTLRDIVLIGYLPCGITRCPNPGAASRCCCCRQAACSLSPPPPTPRAPRTARRYSRLCTHQVGASAKNAVGAGAERHRRPQGGHHRGLQLLGSQQGGPAPAAWCGPRRSCSPTSRSRPPSCRDQDGVRLSRTRTTARTVAYLKTLK